MDRLGWAVALTAHVAAYSSALAVLVGVRHEWKTPHELREMSEVLREPGVGDLCARGNILNSEVKVREADLTVLVSWGGRLGRGRLELRGPFREEWASFASEGLAELIPQHPTRWDSALKKVLVTARPMGT